MKIRFSKLLSIFATLAVFFAVSFSIPVFALATSGCCSGHGGVSCAAGPQGNGNVICNDGWRNSSCSYSSMVMCGGGSTQTTAPVATQKPVSTPVPTPKPTIKTTVIATITPTGTLIPTPTPTVTPTPTSTPEVKGVSTESMTLPKPTPTPAPVTTAGVVGALGFLAVITGLPIWGVVKIVKKFKKIN